MSQYNEPPSITDWSIQERRTGKLSSIKARSSRLFLLGVSDRALLTKFQPLCLHTFLYFLGVLNANALVFLELPSRNLVCKQFVHCKKSVLFHVEGVGKLHSSRERPLVSGRKKISQTSMMRLTGPQIQPILGPQPRC